MCPGVIYPFSGDVEKQIDIVLPGGPMKKFIKHRGYMLETVYIRVEGQEIRCILEKVLFHDEGFIQKVRLKEYIVGEPNQLIMPIQITHFS